MLNIRISAIRKDQTFLATDIRLDIQDSSIISLQGQNARALVLAILGENEIKGDIVLDYISLKADYASYVRNIVFLSSTYQKKLIDTNVTVNEYLDLCCVLEEEFTEEENRRKKEKVLARFDMEKVQFAPVQELGREGQVKLQYIAAFLRKPRLILVDGFFDLVSEECKEEMSQFFRYYISEGAIGIVLSMDEAQQREFDPIIYVVDI